MIKGGVHVGNMNS